MSKRAPAIVVPLLVLALAIGSEAAAQGQEPTISVRGATREGTIARLVGGDWVPASPCPAWDDWEDDRAGQLAVEVSGATPPIAVHRLRPGAEAWNRLTPAVLRLFEGREHEERLSTRQTAGAPVTIDWMFGAAIAGAQYYYFEASRRIPTAPADVDPDTDPPGTVRIAVSGFLLEAGRDVTSAGIKSELRWEQDDVPAGPGRPDLMPLGVVVQQEHPVWVMQGWQGSSTWFALYEIAAGRTRTVLTTRDGC